MNVYWWLMSVIMIQGSLLAYLTKDKDRLRDSLWFVFLLSLTHLCAYRTYSSSEETAE